MAGSVPRLWNILALALETVRPLTKDNWKHFVRKNKKLVLYGITTKSID